MDVVAGCVPRKWVSFAWELSCCVEALGAAQLGTPVVRVMVLLQCIVPCMSYTCCHVKGTVFEAEPVELLCGWRWAEHHERATHTYACDVYVCHQTL